MLKLPISITKFQNALSRKTLKSWSLINSFLGKDSKPTIINELHTEGSVITDGTSIANRSCAHAHLMTNYLPTN